MKMSVLNPPSDAYHNVKRFHKKAFEYINKGLEIDENNGSVSEAVALYEKGIAQLHLGINVNSDLCKKDNDRERMTRLQSKMQTNLEMTQERLDNLKSMQKKPEKSGKTVSKDISANGESNSRVNRSLKNAKKNGDTRPSSGPSMNKPNSEGGSKAKNYGTKFRGLDKEIVDRILNEVVEDKVSVSFNDIAGNNAAKEAIREIVIYPMLRPDLYTGLRAPTKGVLLFGPPGNGKSLLAKAVAYESKCVFFNITAASLMSKWVGESEKMVRALFTMARELQPCIIFMDEIDALLSSRKSGDKDVNRRVLNEFLQEFDGARSSDKERILIMGATNRPFELDDAALRRFPKRIYITMPNQETRSTLLKLLLKKEGNPLSDREIMEVAKLTENYSSHDLTCLAKESALEPLRSLDAKTFQTISSCDVRKITINDFRESLKSVRPSLNSASLKEFDDWNKEFGDISK